MQFMPLVMTGMMAWFPSGLMLYWLTNTVLSIAQQWRINQVVQREAATPLLTLRRGRGVSLVHWRRDFQ